MDIEVDTSCPGLVDMAPPQQRRGQLLGYVYSSPLVRRVDNNRIDRMDQLGTHEELKMIRKKLKDSGRQIRFRAVVATPSNLRELLNSDCRMLHYTGHGNNEFLAFESNSDSMCGIMEPLHVEPLKNLFQAGGVRTKLVFISSCSSELTGNAFVEAGVPHVVAVKREESVTDQAAQQFATQFYDALMSESSRYTVQEAFDIALNLVNATNTNNSRPQGAHFLLLPAGGNHDERIFDTLPEGAFVDETTVPPPRPPGAKPVPFYKGLEELQKVVGLLVDPVAVCVTVTGERGSGKRERAIQACDYVRKRRHFDAVLWADLKKAAPPPNSRPAYEDPCRQIGIAAGMPHPGPETEDELIKFLFRSPPTAASGQKVQKVLLVLEKVDSLFEAGGDAKDRVLKLLSNLCSMGEHLKLLVTSEQSLQRDTHERFRHGSERVARVKSLKRKDAAQLLVDKVPTRFTKKELGLPPDCTRDDVLAALQAHPVLLAAGGHPGTLLRLAPLLEDHSLNDACVLQRAEQHRREYRMESNRLRSHSRASSTNSLASSGGNGGGGQQGVASDVGGGYMGPTPTTPTSPTGLRPAFTHDIHFLPNHQGHNGGTHPNGAGATFFRDSPTPMQMMQHPLLNGAGMAGHSSVHDSGLGGGGSSHAGSSHAHQHHHQHHHRRHSAHPLSPTHSQHHHHHNPHPQRRMTMMETMRAQEELEEPDPPQMTPQEKRAWDTARTAGLIDRGCRLVWVKATANASADGWVYDGSCSGGGGWTAGLGAMGVGGVGAGGGGVGGGVARYDFVPWEYLREGLKQHLCGKLTIPSSHNEVVDDGPVGWINDDLDGGSGVGGMAAAGGYGAVNTPQVRWMNADELAFVRGVLKTKQDKVRQKQERLRKQMANSGFDGSSFGPMGGNGVADAGEAGGGGDEEDVISLEAFVEFSLWWAPLMGTLSLLKNDWASTDPIRVHGFIGRLAAERKLRQMERGTFLLRFSESKQGALVISFTEHVTQAPGGSARSSRGSPPRPRSASGLGQRPTTTCIVKHCLVEVRQGGRCLIEVEQGSTVPYPSLHDLVRACSSMQTLFPNVPKEEAFYECVGMGAPGGAWGGIGVNGGSDAGISMYPPDVARFSGPLEGGRRAGGQGVVLSLEEWGSRPIEMVLLDDDLDAEMTLAAPV